jgi:predicted transposase YbfD/YdcC
METRYFITSLPAYARKIVKAIRSHWTVENSLHSSLDVVFKEDGSLKKKGYSAVNYNIIAKMALTLIDQEKSTKKAKWLKDNWRH